MRKYLTHTVERRVRADTDNATAIAKLATGMNAHIADVTERCDLKEKCTAAMICTVIDMSAWVQVGCRSDPMQRCPMVDEKQVKTAVRQVIDDIK